MDAICTANNQFGLDLAKEISSDVNVIFSPLSIITALSVVYFGATGKTADQIQKALHFENIEDIHSKLKNLIVTINGTGDFTINLANRLFGEQSFYYSEVFMNKSKVWYNSDLEKVDFLRNPEVARLHINKWVREQTQGRIKDVLPENSISNGTELMLTNVIYLLANWTDNLHQYETDNETFTLCTNENKKVQMMSARGYYNIRIIPELNTKILELPYGKNKQLSMFIILPDQCTDLRNIEKNLSSEKINNWTNLTSMEWKYVEFYLPKFTARYDFPLQDILPNLGMKDIFTRSTNLSMTSQDNVYIFGGFHKAYVKFDEDGTELNTNTSDSHTILLELGSLLPEVKFKMDHPFLYVIVHKITKCILFYGKFMLP
ncbi:leukocyte elastase inhibitor isoform X2 [Bombina bombina]|nr:leukocyte elastase inhibitor isoform X2 [Bombina bombina]